MKRIAALFAALALLATLLALAAAPAQAQSSVTTLVSNIDQRSASF